MRTNNIMTQTGFSTQTKKGGFTLIEVIAVLVLLGILAAIALPRYIDMADEARDRAIDAAVSELNGRESLTWGENMLADGGWVADELCDTDLGAEYSWEVADVPTPPTVAGGTLDFQETEVALIRTAATAAQPATWRR